MLEPIEPPQTKQLASAAGPATGVHESCHPVAELGFQVRAFLTGLTSSGQDSTQARRESASPVGTTVAS